MVLYSFSRISRSDHITPSALVYYIYDLSPSATPPVCSIIMRTRCEECWRPWVLDERPVWQKHTTCMLAAKGGSIMKLCHVCQGHARWRQRGRYREVVPCLLLHTHLSLGEGCVLASALVHLPCLLQCICMAACALMVSPACSHC